jgi:xylulokinase
MYLMGYDIGSSSVKATLLDADTGAVAASATSPQKELAILAVQPGWAEQDPRTWWEHVGITTAQVLASSGVSPEAIAAVGISYQMHGLVIVDDRQNVLRPSIIWCDSRAVEIGERAFREIGEETCLTHFLNSPGNFTASKLRWIRENEPDLYRNIHKAMLPGDYIAMRLTGEIVTTPSGLSEGIMWDFPHEGVADRVLQHYDIDPSLLPDIRPTFSVQGTLTASAASELGLSAGTPVAYRAGDQPNNALSLNVLHPGEIAATAGTSGVVYGVIDSPAHDPQSRVNTFVHVNHTPESPHYGVLLCINGTGILNSWLKHQCSGTDIDYEQMNAAAAEIQPGSEGLMVLPFGNGAERTLANRDIAASVHGLRFTTHDNRHLLRAGQEGIAFAFRYGLEIMADMGVTASTIRAGRANMFLSPVFGEAFATIADAVVELYETDGSQGAARGAGIGAGVYRTAEEAFGGLRRAGVIEPNTSHSAAYRETYEKWVELLTSQLS